MTEKKPPSIDAHRMREYGGYSVTQKISTRTRQRELFAKTKTSYRIRQAWKNGNYAATFSLVGNTGLSLFGNKRFVLALALLITIIGGAVLYITPGVFHDANAKQCSRQTAQEALKCDPLTFIWDGVMPSGGLGEYSRNRVTALASGSAPCNNTGAPANPCISLNPDNNGPAIALTNTTLTDLSTVANKNLWGSFGWTLSGTPTVNLGMGLYLTMNGTKPAIGQDSTYNPENDPNVLLYSKFFYQGANVFRQDLLIKKGGGNNGTETVASQNNGGFSGSGSGFITASATAASFNTHFMEDQFLLNFTGPAEGSCSGGTGLGAGCSSVDFGDLGGLGIGSAQTVVALPTNVPLYLGFYAQKGLGANVVWKADSGVGSVNFLVGYQIVAPTTPPSYDSGGFFGPIIKALISIGVFMLSAVFQFFGYVWNALRIGLDLLGNFLGLGAIGTAITNAFAGFVTWISAVLGTVFSNVANVATSIGNELTAIGNVTGTYFTNLGNSLSVLSNLASQFWGVMTTLKLVGTVSASFFLAAWMLWGAVLAFQDIDKFWNQWYRTTGFAILWIFKVLWWSGEAGYGVMLKIKSLIWPTSSGGGIVQTPA